jgi:hypothetical protein
MAGNNVKTANFVPTLIEFGTVCQRNTGGALNSPQRYNRRKDLHSWHSYIRRVVCAEKLKWLFVTLTLILIHSWIGEVEIHKNRARAEIQGDGCKTIFLAKPYHITFRVQFRDVPLQAEHVLFTKKNSNTGRCQRQYSARLCKRKRMTTFSHNIIIPGPTWNRENKWNLVWSLCRS